LSRTAEAFSSINVTVQDVPVEHAVRAQLVRRWLEQTGGSPVEMTRRRRVREISGLPQP
jgi:hypothetical protein